MVKRVSDGGGGRSCVGEDAVVGVHVVVSCAETEILHSFLEIITTIVHGIDVPLLFDTAPCFVDMAKGMNPRPTPLDCPEEMITATILARSGRVELPTQIQNPLARTARDHHVDIAVVWIGFLGASNPAGGELNRSSVRGYPYAQL